MVHLNILGWNSYYIHTHVVYIEFVTFMKVENDKNILGKRRICTLYMYTHIYILYHKIHCF